MTAWVVSAVAERPADLTRTVSNASAAAEALLADHDGSSLSVALVIGEDVAWSGTFGAVDAGGTAPSAETLYGIGSVSKVVTTVAVMQLVDAGRVDLDAAVVGYITDFRMMDPDYTQITVRMLLNHSAGFPGSDYANAFTSEPFGGYAEQMLAQLAQSRLKSVPGSVAVYCNDCFTMAGLLVERVTGTSFTDYVTSHVFEPLGMTRTMYPTDLLRPESFAPVLVDGQAQSAEYLNLCASGALLSTPEEMARLASALLNGGVREGAQVLSAAAIEEMGLDQVSGTLEPIATSGFRYGLGWDTVEDPGLAAVGVRGWTIGGDTVDYHATFMLAPDSDVGVIITAAGRQLGSGMLSTLGGQDILRDAISGIDGAEVSLPAPHASAPAETAATTADLDAMVGAYDGSMLIQVEATPEDSLTVNAYAGGAWLAPETNTLRSDGLFWRTTEPSRSLQTRTAWGRTYLVLQIPEPSGTFLDTSILGVRFAPNDPLSDSRDGAEWVQFGTGIYRPVETIAPLGEGEVPVTIADDATAEWRTLAAPARIQVVGTGSWRAYTADGDVVDTVDGSVMLPAGSLIVVLGDPGDTVTLRSGRR